MVFVGRNKEKNILERFYASKEAELLALYGRRRVGKTSLVRHLFQDGNAYFEVTGRKEGRVTVQLSNFAEALRTTFGAREVPRAFSSWRDAPDHLSVKAGPSGS